MGDDRRRLWVDGVAGAKASERAFRALIRGSAPRRPAEGGLDLPQCLARPSLSTGFATRPPTGTARNLRQGITYPRPGAFCDSGATRKCFDCYYWVPKRPSDKKALCLKAEQKLLRNERPRAIPSYAAISAAPQKPPLPTNEELDLLWRGSPFRSSRSRRLCGCGCSIGRTSHLASRPRCWSLGKASDSPHQSFDVGGAINATTLCDFAGWRYDSGARPDRVFPADRAAILVSRSASRSSGSWSAAVPDQVLPPGGSGATVPQPIYHPGHPDHELPAYPDQGLRPRRRWGWDEVPEDVYAPAPIPEEIASQICGECLQSEDDDVDDEVLSAALT